MILYYFERLVHKYAVSCELVKVRGGRWKAGEWIEGEPSREPLQCAVIPISERRITNSGGEYKTGDCEVVTLSPLSLDDDTYIDHHGKLYKLKQSTDYSDYADFNVYVGKRVSAFERGDAKGTDQTA